MSNQQNKEQQPVSAEAHKIPKIVDLAFDFMDATKRIFHPPKSEKQRYIEAIRRVHKAHPEYDTLCPLPDQLR